MSTLAFKRLEELHHDEATTEMPLEIRKRIVEETISLNPAFDYEGIDEEVAQALLDLAYYGERHRERLARYARQRASQFVWLRARKFDEN